MTRGIVWISTVFSDTLRVDSASRFLRRAGFRDLVVESLEPRLNGRGVRVSDPRGAISAEDSRRVHQIVYRLAELAKQHRLRRAFAKWQHHIERTTIERRNAARRRAGGAR